MKLCRTNPYAEPYARDRKVILPQQSSCNPSEVKRLHVRSDVQYIMEIVANTVDSPILGAVLCSGLTVFMLSA
jgi:hypothetical protein